MNLGATRLRGRPRNRWRDEVREDGRIVGRERWHEKVHNREEWKKLLRTARNRHILHMPMEWKEWKPGTRDVFSLSHSNVVLAPFCCTCPLLSGSQRLLASCALVCIFCPCTDTCNLPYAALSSCNKTIQHYIGHTGISQHEVLKPYSSDTKLHLGLSSVILIITGPVSDGPNNFKR